MYWYDSVQNPYICIMMKNKLLILILVLLPVAGDAAHIRVPEPEIMQFIVNFDREISGLLDAYLEAVPECPVYPDTPVRLWVLDLAWIRADAAITEAETLITVFSDSTEEVWLSYLDSSAAYLNVFSEIQRTYHLPDVPDSSICIELENELLIADSLWRIDEMKFFALFTEEEIQ
ncbi:MAG: hypothetical protein KAR44_14320 [Candidatus Aegiribacteria sp.]|nr:hypothetical protein [Candidatus Aegiribacteria sp.]